MRAAPGGVGQFKVGGNYAPTIAPQARPPALKPPACLRAHACNACNPCHLTLQPALRQGTRLTIDAASWWRHCPLARWPVSVRTAAPRRARRRRPHAPRRPPPTPRSFPAQPHAALPAAVEGSLQRRTHGGDQDSGPKP